MVGNRVPCSSCTQGMAFSDHYAFPVDKHTLLAFQPQLPPSHAICVGSALQFLHLWAGATRDSMGEMPVYHFITCGEITSKKERIRTVIDCFTVSVDWIAFSALMDSTNSGLKIFEKNNACTGCLRIFLSFFRWHSRLTSTQHCIASSVISNTEMNQNIPGDFFPWEVTWDY